jgi:hypothetical protein
MESADGAECLMKDINRLVEVLIGKVVSSLQQNRNVGIWDLSDAGGCR